MIVPDGRLWFAIRRLGLPGRRYGGIPVVVLALTGSVLGGLTAGWFLLSFLVAHNDAVTAVRESIGVSLGLLMVASMIGAVRGAGRRPHRGE